MSQKCRITYCGSWSYRPKAASLAEEIHRELAIEPELVMSSGGVFEVEYENELIFSKKEVGRFPDIGEILNLIKGRK